MESENLLTHEQRETLLHAEFDLAVGYPAFPFSKSYQELLTGFERHSLSTRALGALGPRESVSIRNQFSGVVFDLLGIREGLEPFIEATFSGSIAIQRSILAFELFAARRGQGRPTFIILEPCVDFYRSTLTELRCSYVTVDRLPENGTFDLLESLCEILANLKRHSSDVMPVVMLDSPSNPLGEIVNAQTLKAMSDELEKFGGGLILDHCFALAGVHDADSLPLAFRMGHLSCPWIAVWDTGKTFDLNGDKIGVLVSSGESIFEALLASLETIQVSAAARDLQFFTDFLGSAVARELISELRRSSRANLSYLSEIAAGQFLLTPAGGTFVNLKLPEGSSSIESRAAILTRGLSVSSGASFRSGLADHPPFLRLSLARTEPTFRLAVSRLLPLA